MIYNLLFDWPAKKDLLRAPTLVNGSLDQFNRTVEAMIARFPYYDDTHDASWDLSEEGRRAEDEWFEQPSIVRAELEALIVVIDEAALDPDGFWVDFLDSVEMGNWFTTDVLKE